LESHKAPDQGVVRKARHVLKRAAVNVCLAGHVQVHEEDIQSDNQIGPRRCVTHADSCRQERGRARRPDAQGELTEAIGPLLTWLKANPWMDRLTVFKGWSSPQPWRLTPAERSAHDCYDRGAASLSARPCDRSPPATYYRLRHRKHWPRHYQAIHEQVSGAPVLPKLVYRDRFADAVAAVSPPHHCGLSGADKKRNIAGGPSASVSCRKRRLPEFRALQNCRTGLTCQGTRSNVYDAPHAPHLAPHEDSRPENLLAFVITEVPQANGD